MSASVDKRVGLVTTINFVVGVIIAIPDYLRTSSSPDELEMRNCITTGHHPPKP
jgi:hypothetical protein